MVAAEPTARIEPNSATRQVMAVAPWIWLALSAAWAVVIFATDQPAWPLAVWIAVTLGPLTVLWARIKPHQRPTTGAEQ